MRTRQRTLALTAAALVVWLGGAPALGYDLAGRWILSVELFGNLPASDPEPAEHADDGGVTVALRRGVRLDAAAGSESSGGAPEFFAGVGASLRFDR